MSTLIFFIFLHSHQLWSATYSKPNFVLSFFGNLIFAETEWRKCIVLMILLYSFVMYMYEVSKPAEMQIHSFYFSYYFHTINRYSCVNLVVMVMIMISRMCQRRRIHRISILIQNSYIILFLFNALEYCATSNGRFLNLYFARTFSANIFILARVKCKQEQK